MTHKALSSTHLDYFLLMRAIACFMVIRQHLEIIPRFRWDWILIGNPNSGGQAVVAFIILSGYLITKVLIQKYKFSLPGLYSYYLGRFARLVPLYYFVTTLTIYFIFPYIISSGEYLKQLFQLYTLTYYGGLPYWNQVYWAVSVEAMLYIVAPIFAFIYSKFQTNKLAFIFPFIWLYLIQSRLYITILTLPTIIILTSQWIGIFLLGGSLNGVVNNLKGLDLAKYGNILRPISLILFYLAVAFPWQQTFTQLNDTMIPWTLFSSVLLALFILIVEVTGGSQIKAERSVSWVKQVGINLINRVGHLSYAVFLIHMVIVSRVNDTIRPLIGYYFSYGVTSVFSLVFAIILSVLLAEFLFRSIEIPARNWLLTRFQKKLV